CRAKRHPCARCGSAKTEPLQRRRNLGATRTQAQPYAKPHTRLQLRGGPGKQCRPRDRWIVQICGDNTSISRVCVRLTCEFAARCCLSAAMPDHGRVELSRICAKRRPGRLFAGPDRGELLCPETQTLPTQRYCDAALLTLLPGRCSSCRGAGSRSHAG